MTEVLGIDDNDDESNEGDKGEYETVTIVPSEGESGEVSYVLIVQDPEEKSEGKDDLKVFDFDEAEDPNAEVKSTGMHCGTIFLLVTLFCNVFKG